MNPQWVIRSGDLHASIRDRVNTLRAGFCDITGQTNERTVLAALIPAGVVCGNKVPTIDFGSHVRTLSWVGIANSFIFDWLVRRSITTTLNFFMLRNLPVPSWVPASTDFLAIGKRTELLAKLECEGGEEDLWKLAQLRAEIEVLSARLYGISVLDFDHMMRDFPQVDREQSPIEGEDVSTITRDMIVACGEGWGTQREVDHARRRLRQAQSVGSVPFVPNQHARAYGREQ